MELRVHPQSMVQMAKTAIVVQMVKMARLPRVA